MKPMETELSTLLSPVVQSLDCELWAVEFQPRNQLLRLYIDRQGGVGLGDCERVSRQVSSWLDVENPIDSAYTLEVSSPGIDRRLHSIAHCHRFVGNQVRIQCSEAVAGQRFMVGELCAVDGSCLLIGIGNEQTRLPFVELDSVRLVPGDAIQ